MIASALLYKFDHPGIEHGKLEEALQAMQFVPCTATQRLSMGFVPPRAEHGALAESVGGELILKVLVESRSVPSQAVKTALDSKVKTIEEQTGRRPRGRVLKELKEEVMYDLLPKAFPKRVSVLIWIDRKASRIVLGTASTRLADSVMPMLAQAIPECIIHAEQTDMNPSTAMAHWLATKEAPAGFSIDRECELKQPDSEKAAVRYSRHQLEIDEVAEHIKQGKHPVKLALTWQGRVSFLLTEGLAIKKVKLLDVTLEGSAQKPDADGFDTDVALFTGELGRMLPDLIDAMGGTLESAGG